MGGQWVKAGKSLEEEMKQREELCHSGFPCPCGRRLDAELWGEEEGFGGHVEGEGQGVQGVSRGRVGQVYEGW